MLLVVVYFRSNIFYNDHAKIFLMFDPPTIKEKKTSKYFAKKHIKYINVQVHTVFGYSTYNCPRRQKSIIHSNNYFRIVTFDQIDNFS